MSTETEVPRDRWGRPLIIPVGGGKPVGYTRASTLGGTLEDKTNITNWKMRNVALGLAARPDLVALTAAKRCDKKALDKITKEAREFALASAAANIGTALHGFAEQINRGEEPWGVPAELQADVAAYRKIITKWEVLDAELFVVCDELKVAGTFDFRAKSKMLGRTNLARIFDLKTGAGAVTYGQGEIAVQLAVYAHGQRYDPATGERTPLDVDLGEAFVVHLPAGTGKVTLYRVDIVKGWEAAQKAVEVREWRKQKKLFAPFDEAEVDVIDTATETVASLTADPTLVAAHTIEHVRQAYRLMVADGHDPTEVEAACRARLAVIGA